MNNQSEHTNTWQGNLVRLRAFEASDWEIHYHWDQDSKMERQLYNITFPRSQEATRRWAEKEAAKVPQDDNFFFEIENLTGEQVGIISIHDCSTRHGTFSYGVAIRSEHQRKGYASEAIILVLRYYFQELRYQKVTTPVFSFNEASLSLHEQLGFQQEGRVRRKIFTRGQYFDEIVFGMTVEEFTEIYTKPS
jgi:RimJ/RimL family protein N-acetyltransferase